MDPATASGARRGVKAARWLLLVHQLPASPSKTRVKTWRRLRQLGAVAVRNAVYVLPDSPQSREDFEWMKAEIVANRGEASVFSANTVDSLTDDDIVAAFRADRQRDFEALREQMQRVTPHHGRPGTTRGAERRRLARVVAQLRDRLVRLTANDFFGAAGRQEAAGALAELERLVAGPPAAARETAAKGHALRAEDYRGRTWLTRPRPGIDRAASAWLIRRFIDPAARFVFGERPTYPRAVPFDTYDGEFSHHGDRCTFEVLANRFGIADTAVAAIARLVHDLDLKESRYNVPEAATIGRLIDGLRLAFPRDEALLEHGIAVFEALYRAYSGGPAPDRRKPRERRRAARNRKGRHP